MPVRNSTATTTTPLELRGIGKIFGRSAVLRSLDLRVEVGEKIVLLGRNGSGKTTFLKIIAGALAPTVGAGLIFGHDMVKDRPLVRRDVGFLSAESYLYDDLSALENLKFVTVMSGQSTSDHRLNEALELVGLDGVAGERVRTFSSGMKRRLALARLELLRPRLILLDEPYTNLDADGSRLVDGMVNRCVASGGAAIIATHDLERGASFASRLIRLENGRLLAASALSAQGESRANALV